MRLDGDEMATDADDGDAGHAMGTYIRAQEESLTPLAAVPQGGRARGCRITDCRGCRLRC